MRNFNLLALLAMPLVAWGCNQGHGWAVTTAIGFGVFVTGYLMWQRVRYWGSALKPHQSSSEDRS